MKKILTISIAAYNVENYIKNTLDSLLVDDIEDLEILVEDDGGTDDTAKIVKEYEKKYPGIVKLIHKENGGYGSTINKSIELAQGKYFKQLDGDDWFNKDNFKEFLNILRKIDVDTVYTPYIEFFENKNQSNKRDFFDDKINGKFDIETMCSKSERYLNMYMLTYKTDILKENNIKLMEKCFYTDTEYALFPILYCNSIYVMHLPLYIYRIGREGQSVSIEGRLKHYDDHIKISKKLLDFWNNNKDLMNKEKREYIFNYITLVVATTLGDYLLLLKANKENLDKLKKFESYVNKQSVEIYDEIARKSKAVFWLRESNYKLYKILNILKRRKIKKM